MNDESVLVGTTLDMPLVPVREDFGDAGRDDPARRSSDKNFHGMLQ
jgi:hypothetical protein